MIDINIREKANRREVKRGRGKKRNIESKTQKKVS